MGFRNVAAIADAHESGRTRFCSFRKVPSQPGATATWSDGSMHGGNPPPNYYASTPLVAATLDGNKGLFHGSDVAPASLFLADWLLTTPSFGFVGPYILMDYLLYYPFIEGDEGTEQTMDNTVTLPRCTDGEGVRVMAVALAPTTGGGSFTFDYINQAGVLKTSPVQVCSFVSVGIATMINSKAAGAASGGQFLTLANGDTGVRSVVSVLTSGNIGGLFALVLVKPLAGYSIREINAPAEVSFPAMMSILPRIEDGAYLNFIHQPGSTLASTVLAGYCRFIWDSLE